MGDDEPQRNRQAAWDLRALALLMRLHPQSPEAQAHWAAMARALCLDAIAAAREHGGHVDARVTRIRARHGDCGVSPGQPCGAG